MSRKRSKCAYAELFKAHCATNGFRFIKINQPWECQCSDCCGISFINSILSGAWAEQREKHRQRRTETVTVWRQRAPAAPHPSRCLRVICPPRCIILTSGVISLTFPQLSHFISTIINHPSIVALVRASQAAMTGKAHALAGLAHSTPGLITPQLSYSSLSLDFH